jgi:hypothetical protein
MVQLCETQVARRRDLLRRISKVEEERDRRRRTEKAEAERQRTTQNYLERLASLGNAVSPGDIDRAQHLRPRLRRNGGMFAWEDFVREPEAPQFVQRPVLIARLKQAWRHGQCSSEQAAALAGLVVDNAAGVSGELEQIDAVAACGPAPGEPPDFEAAIAAIEEATGLDPPPPRTSRLRPLESDTVPRRLSDIFATLQPEELSSTTVFSSPTREQ